ncbi:response regulator [Massilia sp. TS11]|uniref:response regulator n=1 Tax=Massilia sp. TS11 TaxID=2908003 RepID=UPI001EDBEB97|nr:response regulator [Massilia sp. TS11]MCG2582982.1 response regulator [Massilia sp. TS11]
MSSIHIPPTISALRVLVVDDDVFMTELIETMLRKLGISHVRVAGDGLAALTEFDPGLTHPDVVVCDLSMPEKDGFEVMEEISARGYRGGLILMSGQSSRVLNSAALMGRFHHLNLIGVLQKPVQRVALGAALAQAIEIKVAS